MRHFIDVALDVPAERYVGPLGIRAGDGFEEIEWGFGQGWPAFVFYRMPVTSTLSVVAGCCGDLFDPVIEETLRDGSDKDALGKEVGEHWPWAGQLLLYGQRGELDESGMMRMVDPADGVKKGFIATKLDHSADPAVQDKALKAAVIRVIGAGVSVVGQGTVAIASSPHLRRIIGADNDMHVLDERLTRLAMIVSYRDLAARLEAAA